MKSVKESLNRFSPPCLFLLLLKPRRLKIGQTRTCIIKQGAGETAGYVIGVPFYYTAYKKHSEL